MADKYERFFCAADTDNSGTLTLEELTAVLKKQGYGERDIRQLFQRVDTSGDGLISKDEFMIEMGQMEPKCHKRATMRNVFLAFDIDGNGKIDKDELRQVFKEMGKHFEDYEVKRMIELADKDGSGTLEYEEFIKFVFG